MMLETGTKITSPQGRRFQVLGLNLNGTRILLERLDRQKGERSTIRWDLAAVKRDWIPEEAPSSPLVPGTIRVSPEGDRFRVLPYIDWGHDRDNQGRSVITMTRLERIPHQHGVVYVLQSVAETWREEVEA